MKFNFKKNEQTGLAQAQFQAKLISPLSETTLQNSNGKNYKLVTLEFENSKGVAQQASAAIYEGNYSKGELTPGRSYLTTVTINEGKAYLQMSHLENAAQASADDFGFDEAEIGVTATTAQVADVKI